MLTFAYDRAELYEVGWRLRRLSSPCRFIDRSLFVGLPVLAFVFSRPHVTNGPEAWFISVAAIILWCVLAPWLHRYFSNVCVLVVMLDRYHCFPRSGYVNVQLSLAGVAWDSTHSHRFTAWSSVRRIVLDPDYVYIQVNFRTYNWLPRRIFRTEAEWSGFLAQVDDLIRGVRGLKVDTCSMNPRIVA